jgi:hypothetical protein
MNLHFQSFLVDVASWVVFAVIYSKYILRRERMSQEKRNIAYIMITLSAFIGGLIATADRSLPEYGFAFYHFFVACLFAFVYSMRYVRRFRRYATSQINYFLRSVNIPAFKTLQK